MPAWLVQSAGASRHVSHHISSGWATAMTSSVYSRRLLPRLNDSESVCDISITCSDRTCQHRPMFSHVNHNSIIHSSRAILPASAVPTAVQWNVVPVQCHNTLPQKLYLHFKNYPSLPKFLVVIRHTFLAQETQ